MPMLGDLLAAARHSSSGFEAWLDNTEKDLASLVAREAGAQGLSVTAYVRGAMSDFHRFASEEDWAMLISKLRHTSDPGTICLLGMVHWRLNARGCRDHASSGAALAEEQG